MKISAWRLERWQFVKADAYLRPWKTSTIALFCENFFCLQLWTIFRKKFHHDVWQSHKCASWLSVKKCPNSEFFWSVFFRIRTEYRDLWGKSPYSIRMGENRDQKNSEYRHLSYSARLQVYQSIDSL